MTSLTPVAKLTVGDVFLHRGVDVLVMAEGEPTKNLFGQPMLRFWCQRLDTDKVGWVTVGPDASVTRISTEAAQAADSKN